MESSGLSPHIPINLPDEHKHEALTFRNKLLAYRFANRLAISIDESLYDPTLTPRANQVTLPLFSLIDDPTLHRVTKQIVTQTHTDTLADRAASPAGALLALLIEFSGKEDRKSIGLHEVTAKLVEASGRDVERPITNRYVGSLLRNALGIHPYKSHGTYQVPLVRERIALLAARYGLER
jgi:hypothetical protein